MRVALVAGASGLTGSHCVQQLLQTREYSRVVALVRRPRFNAHASLEERVADLRDLRQEHVAGADDVFCAVGTTIAKAGSQDAFRSVDHDGVLQLGRYAVETGCRQMLVVSSVDARADSANFYLRVKGEVERDLAELGFETLQIFRPSFLMGDRRRSRRAERAGIVIAKLVAPLLVGRLRKYRAVEADVLASAMIRAALTATPGRHIYHFDDISRLASTA